MLIRCLSINQIAIVLDRAYNTIHTAIRDLEAALKSEWRSL